ncbi:MULTISPECIES: peptidylprolyl isomerase [unclassified Sphingomonas]|uniref:peptidylprolyl isomerase n=1 Tax=unclassified Sphingomonas TaxID=196159 RepID=UPI002457757D|nr:MULTISPECIES: peptidylprolyl isomerase [unclassified Sphingomonas]MDH4745213.1 peptidylprolyl isomerase [Sphingomonas sp. CBMAI 2297]
MNIGVTKAIRAGRSSVLALAISSLASAAMAQTAPNAPAPAPATQEEQEAALAAQLDLPRDLKLFGKADPNVRKPTAIVNDTVLTGTDVDQRLNLIIALNKLNLKPEERDQYRMMILRQLIDETLQIQEAKANEIKVDPKEIDQSFASVARRLQKTPEQMRAFLRQAGASERTMRKQVEGEVAWSRLLRRKVDINVSDEEAKAILDRLKAAQGSEEYHVYEIYMNATEDRKQEVYAGMQRIIQQMKEGAPFDYLAKTYSESSTKGQGGDLGWVRLAPGILPDEMTKAVEEMQPGQVAGPIPLTTGFTVVYLADKRKVGMADPRGAKLSLRQITISFPKGTTEAQATARAGQFAQATQAIKGCGDASNVAAAQNAEVVEKDGVIIGELPPALQQIILPLQVGQVTQPFGTIEDGVRVLVVCGRDDPPAAGLPSLEQIQDGEADKRTNLRAQRMLRDLRRDALIEYR